MNGELGLDHYEGRSFVGRPLRGTMAVIVAVAAIVAVSAPVMVAALVNGNDTVGEIDAVSDDATGGWDGL
jgi:hypothetical protein